MACMMCFLVDLVNLVCTEVPSYSLCFSIIFTPMNHIWTIFPEQRGGAGGQRALQRVYLRDMFLVVVSNKKFKLLRRLAVYVQACMEHAATACQ